jgi:enoyl-CoA hydratase/carnithine racemase
MTLTGNYLDGKTAYEWGVFDFLEAPEDVDAKALEIAKTIATRSPAAVEMGKQLVDQMYLGQVINGVRQELLAQSSLFQTQDYQEQRAALREKRPPVFKRR